MNYNHEDAVTIRTNGRKNDASALCALRDVLEGKALIYDDGRALLKIDCYSVPYRNDADEKIVSTAYDWMDELDDPDIDTIF